MRSLLEILEEKKEVKKYQILLIQKIMMEDI